MERSRFEKELEFVQTLCNPDYLQFLYEKDFFKDESFKKFLKYLQYWKTEPYRNFLLYPKCLEILDLLHDEKFIDALADEKTIALLGEQQFFAWQHRKEKK